MKKYLSILLFLIIIIIGSLPFINVEGDASYYIAGCERLFSQGLNFPPDYIYQWNMQPLIAVFIVLIKHLFNTISAQTIYSALSMLAGIGTAIISAKWIAKKVGYSYATILVFSLLVPEVYSICYYPSTSVFASLCFWIGILLLEKKPINIISVLLFGIAPLFRVDILILYPFLLFVFLENKTPIKTSIINTSIYAATTVTILLIGCWILKANPLQTIFYMSDLQSAETNPVKHTIQFHLAFYTPIMVILSLFGISSLIKKKKWSTLILILVPILIFYIVYYPFDGWGPKHFLYLTPIYTLLMWNGWIYIKSIHSKILYGILALILLGQSIIGIQYKPNDKPWNTEEYAELKPEPNLCSIYSLKTHKSQLELVIGCGTIISTPDELMPISGYLFAPYYWHQAKNKQAKNQNEFKLFIDSQESNSIHVIATQASLWPLSQNLHQLGFEISNLSTDLNILNDPLCYKRDSQTIYVHFENVERNIDSFNQLTDKYTNRPLYLFVDWDWQKYYIQEKLTKFIPISTQISYIE